MLVSTPSGFVDAPVTKRIIFFTAVLPLVISLLEVQYLFDLSFTPQLTIWHQWWRIPISQLAYVDQVHVLLALLLFYNLRIIERFMGSRKFLSYVFIVYCLSVCVMPILLTIFSAIPLLKRIDHIPAGQTSVIFALLLLYHRVVPVMYRCQLIPGTSSSSSELKAEFSDKAILYTVAIQLALSYPPGSIISALVGWTIGGLIHSEIIPGKNWRIPFYHKLGLEVQVSEPTRDTESTNDDHEEVNQEQAPHRPLASQVLDTFRTV